jgi:hypothetical protein
MGARIMSFEIITLKDELADLSNAIDVDRIQKEITKAFDVRLESNNQLSDLQKQQLLAMQSTLLAELAANTKLINSIAHQPVKIIQASDAVNFPSLETLSATDSSLVKTISKILTKYTLAEEARLNIITTSHALIDNNYQALLDQTQDIKQSYNFSKKHMPDYILARHYYDRIVAMRNFITGVDVNPLASQLGVNLQKLAEGLEGGGVHAARADITDSRKATETNAGEAANVAILQFSEYLANFTEGEKKGLFELKANGGTENFGQLWQRLATPNVVDLNNTRYCVELLAPQIKTILKENPSLFTQGELTVEFFQNRLAEAKQEFLKSVETDNYKLVQALATLYQSQINKIVYELEALLKTMAKLSEPALFKQENRTILHKAATKLADQLKMREQFEFSKDEIAALKNPAVVRILNQYKVDKEFTPYAAQRTQKC